MDYELGQLYEDVARRVDALRGSLDLGSRKDEISRLENVMGEPGFWDDKERQKKVISALKFEKSIVEPFERILRDAEDLEVLREFAEEEDNEDQTNEFADAVQKLATRVKSFELLTLLSGEHDRGDCFVIISAGEGGTDACDFVAILLRMYSAWAKNKGYEVELIDEAPGEEAGYRSVTFAVKGPFAYGNLQGEIGVQRLVRFSPFNADAKRQTSFAGVDVIPMVEDESKIEIDMNDVRIDIFCASGAGGQHVNKTASAVRMTHNPTGIVVSCQNERSQHQNRAQAIKLLAAKLGRREEEERAAKQKENRASKGKAGFGQRIRSYFIHPETRVKDERTEYSTSAVHKVLGGDIDELIETYLRWKFEEN
ncbi:MAG: peptide chain release factor 2 [Planctomycetes bacterium]|nr:peptide chain release factor 2 [Planctomycetota bacterium]MCR4318222.1 peptide chain release factor 2 [Planctomycetota bacterium]